MRGSRRRRRLVVWAVALGVPLLLVVVDEYDFVDVHLDQSGGGSQATVDVGVTNTAGRKVEGQLTVVKENGRWWVCDR